MQNDKNFKELLSKGALEETSCDFTSKVMRKIEGLAVTGTAYQPLISYNLKRVFLIVFATILSAVLAISIFIQPSNLPYNFYIKLPSLSSSVFYNLVCFIITFWLLMLFNYFLNRRNFRNNWS